MIARHRPLNLALIYKFILISIKQFTVWFPRFVSWHYSVVSVWRIPGSVTIDAIWPKSDWTWNLGKSRLSMVSILVVDSFWTLAWRCKILNNVVDWEKSHVPTRFCDFLFYDGFVTDYLYCLALHEPDEWLVSGVRWVYRIAKWQEINAGHTGDD